MIRGQVVDVTQAALGKALIRVTSKDSTSPIFGENAEMDGTFCLKGLNPGTYTVKASARGFRATSVHDVVVRSGDTTNLGAIRLELGGCDAPGVICDSLTPDISILAQTDLYLRRGCGADLGKGKSVCPESKTFAIDIDVVFLEEQGALFLRPANGAQIDPGCRIGYSDQPLRVDGLGPGDDFCVKTKKGRISHVFFEVNDVQPSTTELIVWMVTRK